MNVVCVGYRDWAINIYNEIVKNESHNFLILRSKEQFDEIKIINFEPDLILFYGWSWIVSDSLLSSYLCLMLHPSPLPKYRGGSPIQNQIVAGEKKSAVSIFAMTSELDAGDILAQEEFYLDGNISEIFNKITEIGIRLTKNILAGHYVRLPQRHELATYYKRRKPIESHITQNDLEKANLDTIYNKIRMLEDPYPNAFILIGQYKIEFTKVLIKANNYIDCEVKIRHQ